MKRTRTCDKCGMHHQDGDEHICPTPTYHEFKVKNLRTKFDELWDEILKEIDHDGNKSVTIPLPLWVKLCTMIGQMQGQAEALAMLYRPQITINDKR